MRRRDRHARAAHPDGDRRRRPPPGFRLRSLVSFERVVRDALADVSEPVARAVAGTPVDVTDLPPTLAGRSPLVTVDSDGRRVQRLTVHRRPAEQRAADRADLADLLRDAIEVEVADALGFDPDVWDG